MTEKLKHIAKEFYYPLLGMVLALEFLFGSPLLQSFFSEIGFSPPIADAATISVLFIIFWGVVTFSERIRWKKATVSLIMWIKVALSIILGMFIGTLLEEFFEVRWGKAISGFLFALLVFWSSRFFQKLS